MRLISDDALGALTIWAEAQGEPYIGKVAIGEVIRDRAASRYDSDGTIAGTVARRMQFSFFNDDSQDNSLLIRALQIDEDDPVVRECVRAWAEAQGGSSNAAGAVLYANLAVCTPSWLPKAVQVAQIGRHTFFKEQ